MHTIPLLDDGAVSLILEGQVIFMMNTRPGQTLAAADPCLPACKPPPPPQPPAADPCTPAPLPREPEPKTRVLALFSGDP